MAEPVFPGKSRKQGLYESFFLRAVSPEEPLGVWIRHTVHKRPHAPARGALWCTVFDPSRGAPFMHKHTTGALRSPTDAWIEIGEDSRIGPGFADGHCGAASWSLRFASAEPELRHLEHEWLYRSPLPRTKLTSPVPAGSFDGKIELAGRTIELRKWPGMVGHNWGSEHAERWIWLHGVGFEQDPSAWIDVALGRVLVAGRLMPWVASGAVSLHGERLRLGGLRARVESVTESVQRCSLTLAGADGLRIEAHVDAPSDSSAGWRYADPVALAARGAASEHDVVNCSIASLTLNVHPRGRAATILHTEHGAAYELGMRERNHGIPLAPFPDG